MNVTRVAEHTTDIELERRIAKEFVAIESAVLLEVSVSCRRRVATLSGQVTSEYERQVARQTTRGVSGVQSIVDNIHIVDRRAASDRRGGVSLLDRLNRIHPLARRAAAAFAALVVISVGGYFCFQPVSDHLPVFPTMGKITFEGRPIADAIIVFHPKNAGKDAPRPTGRADKEGNFTLTTYLPGDGAPSGEYIVTAEQYQAVVRKEGDVVVGGNVLPAKYGSPIRSSLCARIVDGQNLLPILTLSR